MTEEKKPARMSPREKAALHPKSAVLAIASYCYHSCFGQEDANSHTTKVDIRDCKSTECPLWPHRSWKTITGGSLKPRQR